MPKPIHLLNVQEAHKEYNSLTDQIREKYKQLDSVEFGAVVEEPQTSVLTVSTNITFNALHALIFVLTVSTNKIPYSIHNSIALIFCIKHLDMPFNVHTTDKVTMITVSGFLTI